ncbi:MAG: hypothetical protein OHK0053_23480 [Microscillaceae bacterium]
MQIQISSIVARMCYVLIVSCSPQSEVGPLQTEVSVVDGRLKFANPQALVKFVNSQSSTSKFQKLGFRPLKGLNYVTPNTGYINVIDDEPFELPIALLTLFDEKGEYQVGNTIVFFKWNVRIYSTSR